MKQEPNDLWEDMDRLNTLYEELCWDIDDYDRYTISFNSFPAGVIGDMSNLAGLIIEVL